MHREGYRHLPVEFDAKSVGSGTGVVGAGVLGSPESIAAVQAPACGDADVPVPTPFSWEEFLKYFRKDRVEQRHSREMREAGSVGFGSGVGTST